MGPLLAHIWAGSKFLKNVSHCLRSPLAIPQRNHCAPFAHGAAPLGAADFRDQLKQVIGTSLRRQKGGKQEG